MAISILGGPGTWLVVPEARATTAAMVTDAPVGFEANATVANLELETIATSTNITTQEGLEGAHPAGAGTPSSSSLSLTLATKKPGRVDASSTYTATDGSTIYGSTPLWVPTGHETVIGVASGDGYANARGLAMADGTRVIVAERALGTDGVVVYRKAAGAATYSAAVGSPVWTTSTAFTSDVHATPQIVSIPSETTSGELLMMLSLEVTAANTQTLRMDYSTDGGDTWTAAGESNLSLNVAAIYYELQDLTYDDGPGHQLCLTVRRNNAGVYTLLTYTSNDFGATWDTTTAMNISDVRIARQQYFCGLHHVVVITGANVMNAYSRSSADSSWTAKAANFGDSPVDTGHLGFVILPSGRHLVYYREQTSTHIGSASASDDGGATYGAVSTYPATGSWDRLWSDDTGGLTDGLNYQDAIYSGGNVWILGNYTSTGTTDNSIAAIKLGDYSNIQWNQNAASGASNFPLYPAAVSTAKSAAQYTFTTSGATTDTIVLDATGELVERLSTDNSTGYITHSLGAPAASGVHMIMGTESTGGSTASSALAFRAGSDDGANYVACEVRIDASNHQLQLYDLLGAANRGSVATYTTGAPLELYVAISLTTGKASAWYKRTIDSAWTAIATNQTVTSGAGTISTALIGKITASAAQFDLLWYWARQDDGYDDGSRTTVPGIPAMSSPDRLPAGIHIRWDSSPLLPGNTWTVRARSTTPISFISPLSVQPSPLRQWVGTAGSAGATYRVAVFDMGANYAERTSDNMVGIAWAGSPGVAYWRLRKYTGAALSTLIEADTRDTAFGAGSCGIKRAAATSYRFRPNASNSNPRVWRQNQYKGWWCSMSDGSGNTIAGTVACNDPGQFTTTTGALQASIELDPSTVVEVAGTFAGFSTATTTGTLYLYSPDGVVIGASLADTSRYLVLEMTLAGGATVPKAGSVWFGPAYAFARPARDGASTRWVTDPQFDRPRRIVEIPFDQLLPRDMGVLQGATVQNTVSFDGIAPRAISDNNIQILIGALHQVGARHGQRRGLPVALVLDGDWQADPGTSVQSFVGDSMIMGYLSTSVDVTTGRGMQIPNAVDGTEQGTSFVVNEPEFYIPTRGV